MKFKARIAFALALGLLVGLLGPASPAQAAWTAPRSERLMSGPARPGVAAWGLAYNNVSGQMVVGDYVSSQVRRYSLAGVHLGDFVNPKGSTEGVASAVAVDPRNGATYLAVTGDGKTSKAVRKYDAAGNFMYDFNLSGSVTWITVDDQGNLWQPQGFGGTKIQKWQVSDATKLATLVTSFGTGGTGAGQTKWLTGASVAEALNRIYVVDSGNGVVHCFSTTTGAWLFDIGNRALFPGDMRGVQVDDARGRVYAANSQAGTIEVFDLNGKWLFRFSALGNGPDQMVDGARGLTQTPDGDLWAADYGGRRVIRFTADGALKSAFPSSPAQPAPPGGLGSARGITMDPTTGDVITVDGWNQRIQRFAPDGTFLGAFGRRGSLPPDGMNYPRSAAVDPATGDIWVGNYRGRPDADGLRPQLQLQAPDRHAALRAGHRDHRQRRLRAHPTHDAERAPLQRADRCADRRLLHQPRQSAWHRGRPADRPLLDHLGHDEGRVRGQRRRAPRSGPFRSTTAAGASTSSATSSTSLTPQRTRSSPSTASPTPASARSAPRAHCPARCAARRGSRTTRQGASTCSRSAAHGCRYSAGRRRRRRRPSPRQSPGAATTSRPDSCSSKGTATDAGSGVAQVEVVVKDESTGLYYNGIAAVWANQAWNQAVASGPASSMSWSYTLPPTVSGRTYTVRVRARDFSGNYSTVLTRLVSVGDVEPPPGPDTVAPDTTITQPSFDASLPHAAVTILGGSTDNIGVTGVEVAIQDRVSKKWWDPTTSAWGTPQRWLAGTLQAPGATASPWSAVWNEPAATGGSGSYLVLARGKDAAGNVEIDRPSTRFTVG